MNYPSPCDKCGQDQYTCTGCNAWRTRYLYRQKQINAYARKIRKQKQEPPSQSLRQLRCGGRVRCALQGVSAVVG